MWRKLSSLEDKPLRRELNKVKKAIGKNDVALRTTGTRYSRFDRIVKGGKKELSSCGSHPVFPVFPRLQMHEIRINFQLTLSKFVHLEIVAVP